MAKGSPVGEDEERAILAALESGKTTRQVATEFNRGKSTISDIARRAGVDMAGRAQMKKADVVRLCYASEARIRLIGKGLDRVDSLLTTCDNARDLQALMMSMAIGIDKRRLEESTDPSARGGEIRILFDKMQGEGEEVET